MSTPLGYNYVWLEITALGPLKLGKLTLCLHSACGSGWLPVVVLGTNLHKCVEVYKHEADQCWQHQHGGELTLWIITVRSEKESERQQGCCISLSVSLCVAPTPKCAICFCIEFGWTVTRNLNKLACFCSHSAGHAAASRCLFSAFGMLHCSISKDFKLIQSSIVFLKY